MLDGILGAASGMVPGGQMLGVVAMGIELAKGLFEKGDMQGTQDMLKFLNEVVSKLSPQGGAACEPQPFTSPQEPAQTQGTIDPQTFKNPRLMNSPRSMDVTIEFKPAQIVGYGVLPSVNGSPADDLMLSRLAAPRIDGNNENRGRALTPGSQEWTTVMWAMQQNPSARYNADTQQFTVKMTDGTDHQLCSLQDAQQAIGAGGFDRGQPSGAARLGEFLGQRTSEVKTGDPSGDLEKLVQELQKLLKQFEDARNMMQRSSIDITITPAMA